MLTVSLITLGSPDQLTGGYLYHRRMADLAPAHDARVDFVSVPAGAFLPGVAAGRWAARATCRTAVTAGRNGPAGTETKSTRASWAGAWSAMRR